MLDKIIRFCLENKFVVALIVIAVVGWGLMVAPFDWNLGGLPRSPVPTDAIPDIGENQQIVFTEWIGRSPQDVEDQITYPLTVSLLGVPGVKTVRSYSFFGFSTIYVIFNEDVEFYWSRTRVLEKLNSLPAGTLPEGVAPTLGPDSTPLGQIFWYTLEGRDPDGNPAGGWDLDELRTIQDWYVRYYLLSAEGISDSVAVRWTKAAASRSAAWLSCDTASIRCKQSRTSSRRSTNSTTDCRPRPSWITAKRPETPWWRLRKSKDSMRSRTKAWN